MDLYERPPSAGCGKPKPARTLATGCAPPVYSRRSRPVTPLGYYAYVIGDDGHIANRVDVVCDNGEDALRHAEQLVDGHAIKLWQGARRIGRSGQGPTKVRIKLRHRFPPPKPWVWEVHVGKRLIKASHESYYPLFLERES